LVVPVGTFTRIIGEFHEGSPILAIPIPALARRGLVRTCDAGRPVAAVGQTERSPRPPQVTRSLAP